MTECINIKEKTPEKDKYVLLYVYDKYEKTFFIKYGQWNETNYTTYEKEGVSIYRTNDVKCWMSLPEPPTED